METILPAAIILSIIFLAAKRISKSGNVPQRQSYGNGPEGVRDGKELKNLDTPHLMHNVLTNIGCQPQFNDDSTLSVKYQGDNFLIEFCGKYARIWDTWWASSNINDPEFPMLKEAVNKANLGFGPTVLWGASNEEGLIGLHSRCDIMLHPLCNGNESYVEEMLGSFFNTREQVRNEFFQLKGKNPERGTKKRRPIGFNVCEGQEKKDE